MGFRKNENRTDKDLLLKKIIDQHTAELPVFQTEYDEQDKGLRYLAGDQYVKDDKAWWELQRRPTRVYNHLLPIYNSVLGDFLTTDQRVRIFPLPGGSIETAKTLEKLTTHFNEENDYKYVFGQWGLDGTIKRGFAYPRFSDEKYFDGSLIFTKLDSFETGFDSRARDYFMDDGWYQWRARWETYDEILARAPGDKKKRIKEFLTDKQHDGFWDSIDDSTINKALSSKQYVNDREGKYLVLEWHYMVMERATIAFDPMTGGSEIIDFKGDGKLIDKKMLLYKKTHPNILLVERDHQKKKKVCEIIPGMMMFLKDPEDAPIQDGTFDFIPFSAYHYARKTIDYFGIFKNAKDPAEGFNEWENVSEDIIKRVADPGMIWRPELINNVDSVRNFGNRPGANIEVTADSNISLEQAFKEKQAPQYPRESGDMALRKLEFLQKVTGITPNFSGASDTKAENASLFAQRVNQAKQTLVVMKHNWARSKRRLYQKCIRIMQDSYPDQKVFWITQKQNNTGQVDPEEIVINQKTAAGVLNDLSLGRYRVIPEDLDQSQSAKALRFAERVQIAQLVKDLYGASVPPEWLLGEAVDLGDMKDIIDNIEQQMQQNAAREQQASALQTTGAIQSLAKQHLDLSQGNDQQQIPQNAPAR